MDDDELIATVVSGDDAALGSCLPGTRGGWLPGIAIGTAAIVAVLGLAAASQAALPAQIAKLGTNLLTVTKGQTFSGATAELPGAAPGMIARLTGVTAVQDTGPLLSRHGRVRCGVPRYR